VSEGTDSEDVKWAELRPQLTKMALELGPLVVFFVVNMRADIFAATAWFMGAMVLALALSWLLLKRIAVMPLVTGIVVLIFGSLTLYFQDSTFIKMKPTIVNALFGGTLLGGLLFGQSLLRYVFGDVYKLKDKGWMVLTIRWGIFFFVLAALNEIVWRGAPLVTADAKAADSLWVAFKVWGIMPLTVIFSMFQLPVLKQYAPDPEPVNPIPPTIEP
jgi:intracellular septation protein